MQRVLFMQLMPLPSSWGLFKAWLWSVVLYFTFQVTIRSGKAVHTLFMMYYDPRYALCAGRYTMVHCVNGMGSPSVVMCLYSNYVTDRDLHCDLIWSLRSKFTTCLTGSLTKYSLVFVDLLL